MEEARAELSTQERRLKHDVTELENQERTLKQGLEELTRDRDEKAEALVKTQQRLVQREEEVGSLENEVMRLKTQTGDVDTLAVIKRELSDQVNHIQKLEATLREQHTELKQRRKDAKAIEVVEEEKRVLETKVRLMHDLRKELSEAQLQRQILEDERRSWTAYLENMDSSDSDQAKFETPEDLAKAYVEERFDRASLVDQLGQVKPELSAKDAVITSLEEQKAALQEELEKLKSAPKPTPETTLADVSKAQARLERQKTLAIKEVEYLRAQLKMFDAEEGEFEPEKQDEVRAKRVQELEDLVDQYRKEVSSLHTSLTKTENASQSQQQPPSTPLGTKRPLSPAATPVNDERLGALTRKNRTLQDSLTQLEKAKALVEKELAAMKSQLKALKSSSRIRVLELRDNPTTNIEKVKMDTLRTLKAENEVLLSQLSNSNTASATADTPAEPSNLVPLASLTRLRADLTEKDALIASKEKHLLRLKQIFTSKSLEFREAVASILGWKMDFMPNGRVRVTSMFHPGDESAGAGADATNSIIFDGEQGTMKVSGGPRSKFAAEIRPNIEYWVEGRKEIPCFLAACTLEFWEKMQAAKEEAAAAGNG